MKQRDLDEFTYQVQTLSEKELEILKTLKNRPNGLKSRQIAGDILPKRHGRGGPSFRSGRVLKSALENLRGKGLIDSDGKKPHQWNITEKGEEILEV